MGFLVPPFETNIQTFEQLLMTHSRDQQTFSEVPDSKYFILGFAGHLIHHLFCSVKPAIENM